MSTGHKQTTSAETQNLILNLERNLILAECNEEMIIGIELLFFTLSLFLSLSLTHKLSLPLSLSLSHTHTYNHTLSLPCLILTLEKGFKRFTELNFPAYLVLIMTWQRYYLKSGPGSTELNDIVIITYDTWKMLSFWR